jgi:hypothetical protein
MQFLVYYIQLLLGPYDLELSRNVSEEVGIRLGHELPLVRLLHKVLVTLFVGEVDGVLFGLELYPVAVHEVGRRLPAHKRVLPSVALGEHVPVHQPVVGGPVAGLCGRLGGLVDAMHD